MKNSWDVLGVDKNISADELKKVYKKLALQFHPDRNPGDKAAEDRFKEITSAYDDISNGRAAAAEARQQAPDISSVEDFFNSAHFSMQQEVRRATVDLSFKEYCLGVEKKIPVSIPTPCGTCDGVGAPTGGYTVCTACGGKGNRVVRQGMVVISLGACPACRGKGKTVTTICTDCTGKGEIDEETMVGVQIPPLPSLKLGLNLNNRIQLQISLKVSGGEGYSISGKNIHTKLNVPLADALFGSNVDVETIHGTKRMKIPPMEKGYTELRLKGLGAGRPFGDHIVEVMVVLPESDDDRVKIKSLLNVDSKSEN